MSEMWHLRLDRLVSQFPGERDPALPAEPRESCFRRQLDSPDLAGKAPALSDRAPQQGDHAEHERLEVRRADPEARLQLVRVVADCMLEQVALQFRGFPGPSHRFFDAFLGAEIGRASWRDRVGSDEEISEVAGARTKTKK